MKRREFLGASAGAVGAAWFGSPRPRNTPYGAVWSAIALAAVLGAGPGCGTSETQALSRGFNACEQEDHPARLDYHDSVSQLDHCDEEATFPEGWTLLTNWGTKPQWLTPTSFVFVSNLIGDVYRMEISTGEIERLTGHFPHAGFTRVHVLSNDDLLLLGPSSGPQPPLDPLTPYEEGMFDGDLFVLRYPYDGVPLPLNEHAWEGVAVSRETLQIAWSTSAAPAYSTNPDGSLDAVATLDTLLNEPSEIRTGTIVYDSEGVPRIEGTRVVIAKEDVGDVLLEPQDFIGTGEESLTVSAYGFSEGFGDGLIVDVAEGTFEGVPHPLGGGFDEWEGVHPDGSSAFIEVVDGTQDPASVDELYLYVYSFDTQEFTRVVDLHPTRPHEPVFSEDGRWALMATFALFGHAGYGAGILLVDMEAALRAQR